MQRAASRERKGTFRQARLEAFVFGDTTKGADREHAVGWEIEIKSTDTEQHHVFPPCHLSSNSSFTPSSLSLPLPFPSYSLPLSLSAGEERETRERGGREGRGKARE
jgi:hypothetical protein